MNWRLELARVAGLVGGYAITRVGLLVMERTNMQIIAGTTPDGRTVVGLAKRPLYLWPPKP